MWTIAPFSAGEHRPAERLGAAQVARDVDVHQLLPVFNRQLVESSGPQNAGVVDQDIALAESICDRFGGLGDTGIAGHVALDGSSLAGFIAVDFAHGFFGGFRIDVERGDAGTDACEFERRRATDATARSGDDASRAVES